jgi:hypothetical protein
LILHFVLRDNSGPAGEGSEDIRSTKNSAFWPESPDRFLPSGEQSVRLVDQPARQPDKAECEVSGFRQHSLAWCLYDAEFFDQTA